MKTLQNTTTILLLIVTVHFSCKKSEDKPDIRNPLNAACLLHEIRGSEDTVTFYYNQENMVQKVEWSAENYLSISYNSEGKINQVDEYHSGTRQYYTEYIWADKQLEAIYYQLEEGDWLGKYRKLYEYNENYEVTKITDFSKDALNTGWIEDGDYYVYEWDNGNLTKAENWDNYSTASSRKLLAPIKSQLSRQFITAKEVYRLKAKITSKSDDYNLFSTTLFEYDDKTNPKRYVTYGNLQSPEDFNISKNNWLSKSYSDIKNKQINYTYSYRYDEKNYPVSVTIQEERIYPAGTVNFNNTESYTYICNLKNMTRVINHQIVIIKNICQYRVL